MTSLNEQEHLAQRGRGAEIRYEQLPCFLFDLCASGSLREVVYFFTALPRARRPRRAAEVAGKQGKELPAASGNRQALS
jgi:hypothetical protein